MPTIYLWTFHWKYLLRYKKTILLISLFSLVGLPADIIASTVLHIWYYNPSQHLGPFIFGLPLGEYVFCFFFPQEFVAMLLLLRRKVGK